MTATAVAAGGATLAAAALLVNAALWGVSWWPFRALQAQGLHSLWATALVYLAISAAIVVADPHSPGHVARTRSLWPLVLGSGLANACFNWAVSVGDVIRVVLLFYLMPAWAALLARALLGEALTAAVAGRVLLAIAGAVVVLQPAVDGASMRPTGADLLAIVGGFGFALTGVMLRREAARPKAARAFAMFAGGSLVAGVVAAGLTAAGTVPPVPAPGAGWLAGLALLALMFGAGNLCLQYGASRLPANVTAVVMIAEVPFASLSAIALGAGAFTTPVAVGGAMIVAAALLAVRDAR